MLQLNLLMHVCEAWEETLVSFNVLLWLLRYPTQFHLPYITYSLFTSKEFCTFSRCVRNKLVGCHCRWLSFLSLHPKYGLVVQESMRYTHSAPWMSTKGWSHIWKFWEIWIVLCFLIQCWDPICGVFQLPICSHWFVLFVFVLFCCDRVGLEKAKKELAESIQKGVSFIKKWVSATSMVFLHAYFTPLLCFLLFPFFQITVLGNKLLGFCCIKTRYDWSVLYWVICCILSVEERDEFSMSFELLPWV